MQALPLKQSLSSLAREPIWIASALSIGFHGLIWFTSPTLFPLSSENLSSKQSTPMIELDVIGQSRLPAQVSPTTNLTIQPPIISRPSNDVFSRFPGGQLFNPSTLPFEPPPPPSYKLPEPPPLKWSIPSPAVSPTPSPTPQPSSSTPLSGNTVKPDDIDSILKTNPINTLSDPSKVAAAQEQLTGTTPSPSPSDTDADYTYSEVGTRQIDGSNQLIVWYAKAKQISGDPGIEFIKLPDPLVINDYLPKRCINNSKSISAAVLADATGKAADSPQLLISSGYGVLNRVALERLRTFSFPKSEAGKYKIYLLNVDFQLQNSSCPPVVPPSPSL